MKKLNKHSSRCTTVEEVKERITKESLKEYYSILKKMNEERKSGCVNSILEREWIDKYHVNPYSVHENHIVFLLHGTPTLIIYHFDNNFNIEKIEIKNRYETGIL